MFAGNAVTEAKELRTNEANSLESVKELKLEHSFAGLEVLYAALLVDNCELIVVILGAPGAGSEPSTVVLVLLLIVGVAVEGDCIAHFEFAVKGVGVIQQLSLVEEVLHPHNNTMLSPVDSEAKDCLNKRTHLFDHAGLVVQITLTH